MIGRRSNTGLIAANGNLLVSGEKQVAIGHGQESVSYTHLDVYKRQGILLGRLTSIKFTGTATERERTILIDIDEANRTAVERMMAARPILRRVAPAREVISGLSQGRKLLHAGPPITWERAAGP